MFYYSYVAFPIIAVFLILIIVTTILVCVKRSHRHRATQVIELRRDIYEVNPPNVNVPIYVDNFIHPHQCVFNDNNKPYWKLNCGAYVCNQCIINFSSAMATSEIVHCPTCSNPVYNFDFINDVNANDRQIDVNISYDLNTSQLCHICYERMAEKKIDCNFNNCHMLCKICYHRLIEVQRILLCPFCRTLIRRNISEEQAPVVLDMQ